MRNLLSPKWLLFVNTLPILVLFIILGGIFQVIKSLLDEESMQYWIIFGNALAGLALINLCYAVFLMVKKKEVSAVYAVLGLIAYIAYICQYAHHLDDIMPFNVPRWMVSGNVMIYACTFLMPMLAYCLFALVVRFTASPRKHKAWVSFLIMVSIPVFVYLISAGVLPFLPGGHKFLIDHVLVILFIVCTLLFLFFLVRGIYIMISKKSRAWQKYELVWKIPIAIILPIAGLAANGGWIFNSYYTTNIGGLFGDFSNYWFLILVFLNGILLCLPNLENKTYRYALFAGRSVTSVVSLYFFLVFLPYLPLSIIAILIFGLGFLLLAPLALFFVHINELYEDARYLQRFYTKDKLRITVVCAFLVIPLGVTMAFMHDRMVLNTALEYVYKADYQEEYDVDKSSFSGTLRTIMNQKNRRDDFFSFNSTPYLSSYYNWLVLDHLTLSDKKIKTLQNIFYKLSSYYEDDDEVIVSNGDVEITHTTVDSRYDSNQNAWVSWVNLEITNHEESGFVEYGSTIDLPEGCWISDYYLYVGDKKEPGILSEKKAAMWVFSQIRNENKDPGILYYLTGNRVAFNVFPFTGNETRRTGIEFIHREPVTLIIDKDTVTLGTGNVQASASAEVNKAVCYVSPKEKQHLKSVVRNSYYHFLIDASAGTEEYRDAFIRSVDKLMAENPTLAQHAKISFVDTYVKTFSAAENWKERYQKQSFDGGFYLDRGLKKALFDAYKLNAYPVIVVLSDHAEEGVADYNYSDFKFIFPESDYYAICNSEGNLATHSFMCKADSVLPFVSPGTPAYDVLEYANGDGTSYLRKDDKPSIVLKKDVFDITASDVKEKNWQTALLLRGQWLSQLMHPEASDREWINLAQYSFNSGIMTPATSYMVVENEAQKQALKKKQKEILAGDYAFDAEESSSSSSSGASGMSEPDTWIVLLLLAAVLLYLRRRKTRRLNRMRRAV